MHLMEAVYYINYIYTHPYIIAGILATICIGIYTLFRMTPNMSDIIPLVLMASIVLYMYD